MITWLRLIFPKETLQAAFRLSEAGFARDCEDSPLLAIRLPPDDASIVVAAPEQGPRIGYHTEFAGVGGGGARSDVAPSADARNVTKALQATPHHVALLRRRVGKAFSEGISVGRAPNTDIVLRHKSVSKVHVYFRTDERGETTLFDAGSKNGTFMGGKRLAPRASVAVRPGDAIQIGALEALFLDPPTLWRALRDA